MFAIVLHQPEIPPNTGNIIRLAAVTGAELHLVEPLGFRWDDKQLRRAGLDYHEFTRVHIHPDWAACQAALARRRLFAFTTKGSRPHTAVSYREDDVFVFGSEGSGLPPAVLEQFPPEQRLRLPMLPDRRSLNLANSAAVAVYEAWRQLDFPGATR